MGGTGCDIWGKGGVSANSKKKGGGKVEDLEPLIGGGSGEERAVVRRRHPAEGAHVRAEVLDELDTWGRVGLGWG